MNCMSGANATPYLNLLKPKDKLTDENFTYNNGLDLQVQH